MRGLVILAATSLRVVWGIKVEQQVTSRPPLPICDSIDHAFTNVARAANFGIQPKPPLLSSSVNISKSFRDVGAAQPGFASILQKLNDRRPLSIAAIGGSMTRGDHAFEALGNVVYHCDGPKWIKGIVTEWVCGQPRNQTMRTCAWPNRFGNAIQDAFPNSTIELANLAHAGFTSRANLGKVIKHFNAKSYDVILLDGLVNDAFGFNANSGRSPRPDMSRFISMFGMSSSRIRSFLSPPQWVTATFEALVRTLREHLPEAQLMTSLSGCPACMSSDDWDGVSPVEVYRNVSDHYGIPTVDVPALVAQWNQFWTCDRHPGWTTHQYFAETFAASFQHELKMECEAKSVKHSDAKLPSPITQRNLLDQLQPSCWAPPSELFATDNNRTFVEVHLGVGWKLFSDVPGNLGKRGWITESGAGPIVFTLDFGDKSILTLHYLLSYENMGSATVKVNGQLVGTINALDTTNPTSQADSVKYRVPVKPNSRGVQLQVQVVSSSRKRNKFKILGVSTC